jgi:hypothetical protein
LGPRIVSTPGVFLPSLWSDTETMQAVAVPYHGDVGRAIEKHHRDAIGVSSSGKLHATN